MPSGRYFLADVVLSGILALPDEQCRQLFSAFDRIADDPLGGVVSLGRDWDGRQVYLARHTLFEIGYVVAPDESLVTFTFFRPIT